MRKKEVIITMKILKRKDLLLLATKLTEERPGPRNDKGTLPTFVKKEDTKSVKESKIMTQQPKTFENSNIFNIWSVIIEHPKTSHKLSKTIRQAEKVSQ